MTILARFLRDRRRAQLWWSLGMAFLVLSSVAFYPAVRDQPAFNEVIDQLPEAVRTLVGTRPDVPFVSPAGYLHGRLFSNVLPVLLIVFGIGVGARAIGGGEEDGTLELLLANPVPRLRVVLERAAGVLLLLAALGLVAVGSLLLTAPAVGLLDGRVTAGRLVLATASATALGLLHAAVALAVGAWTGRRGPALGTAAALAVGGYVVEGLLAATGTRSALAALSPWHWYLDRNVLAHGPSLAGTVLPVALAITIVAAGAARFRLRDLR